MAYNEKLADRIRKALAHLPNVEEKRMFRGLTFMVNGKMCVSVSGEEMMCRFDPAMFDEISKRHGFRTMIMKGRLYKGFGYVNESVIISNEDFDYWIELSISYNKKITSVKRKPKSKS